MHKKLLVSGMISDVTSKTPLAGASINLWIQSGRELSFATDARGKFRSDSAREVGRMEINYPGYRRVVIKL